MTMQDLEGNMLEWSRGAERTYGYSADEAKRMNAAVITLVDDLVLWRALVEAIRRGEEVPSREVRRRSRDGRTLDGRLRHPPGQVARPGRA